MALNQFLVRVWLMLPELTLFVVFVFGYFVYRKVGIFDFYNPAVIFFYAHFLMLGVGGFYRTLYQDVVPIGDNVIYIVSFSLLSFLFGVLVSQLVIWGRSRGASRLSVIVQPVAASRSPLMLLLTFALPIMFFLIFTMKVGGFLWLMDDMDSMRVELRRGLGPIVLLGIASCFVCSILLIHTLRPNLFIAFSLIAIFSIIAGSYGNRAPAGFVLLSSFYYYYTTIRRPPNFWFLLIAFLVFFTFLMALNIVRQGLDFTWYMVFAQVLWRPFVNFQNLDLLHQAVVKYGELQYGYGFLRDLFVLIPGYSGNNAEWIKDYLGLEFSGGGVTITYIGDLLINFSLWPVFAFVFFLGFIFNVSYYFMLVLGVSRCVMLIVSFSSMAVISSGFVPPIINVLVPFLMVYFFLFFLRLFLNQIS